MKLWAAKKRPIGTSMAPPWGLPGGGAARHRCPCGGGYPEVAPPVTDGAAVAGQASVLSPVSSATVRIVANRPASAYSVRARMSSTFSVRGSARISSAPRPAGASQCSMGDVAVASVTNVTPKPKSEATLAVVSQHCSVLMPQMTSSLIPWLVRICCRLVVVKALCEVLVITGSPSCTARPSMSRTYPLAGSNTVSEPASACSTQMTRSPLALAASTSCFTGPTMPGLEMVSQPGACRNDAWTSITMSALLMCQPWPNETGTSRSCQRGILSGTIPTEPEAADELRGHRGGRHEVGLRDR